MPVPRFGAGFDISSPPDSRPHAERDDDRDYYRDIYRRYLRDIYRRYLRAKLSTPYAVYTVGVFAYDHD